MRGNHPTYDPARRVCGRVNQSFDAGVSALWASDLSGISNHVLTRVAPDCRRFAPDLLAQPIEAQGTRSFRDRRCGTGVMLATVFSQLRRGAARDLTG